MSQIKRSDQTTILNKLEAVRRELATLTTTITTLESAVRTNDERVLTSHLQLNPLSGVTAAVQDSYGTIARVFRITNVRVDATPLIGGSASGASPIQAK
jgi:hypothetical protein